MEKATKLTLLTGLGLNILVISLSTFGVLVYNI